MFKPIKTIQSVLLGEKKTILSYAICSLDTPESQEKFEKLLDDNIPYCVKFDTKSKYPSRIYVFFNISFADALKTFSNGGAKSFIFAKKSEDCRIDFEAWEQSENNEYKLKLRFRNINNYLTAADFCSHVKSINFELFVHHLKHIDFLDKINLVDNEENMEPVFEPTDSISTAQEGNIKPVFDSINSTSTIQSVLLWKNTILSYAICSLDTPELQERLENLLDDNIPYCVKFDTKSKYPSRIYVFFNISFADALKTFSNSGVKSFIFVKRGDYGRTFEAWEQSENNEYQSKLRIRGINNYLTAADFCSHVKSINFELLVQHLKNIDFLDKINLLDAEINRDTLQQYINNNENYNFYKEKCAEKNAPDPEIECLFDNLDLILANQNKILETPEYRNIHISTAHARIIHFCWGISTPLSLGNLLYLWSTNQNWVKDNKYYYAVGIDRYGYTKWYNKDTKNFKSVMYPEYTYTPDISGNQIKEFKESAGTSNLSIFDLTNALQTDIDNNGQ